MFTAYHHLVPRLRMISAIPLLPLYAFMVDTETSSPYRMEQSYSWEANDRSFCVHKSLPLYPITGFEAKKKIVT